ncbi:MAG: hypothetical protein LLF95_08290, partial [Bacteroidales bacterium]|nr:hypothetical protein [Bacteroidales bacterium]
FVSHNMGSIKMLCNTGILLSNGTVSKSGEINDVVSHYLDTNLTTDKSFEDCITYKASYIDVDKIEINGKSSNPIQLNSKNNTINIIFEGSLISDQRLAFEFRLFDKNQIPLVFYSPFHYTGETPVTKKGKFRINHEIILPENINKGTYYGSLYLTNPGIAYHLTFENTIQIDTGGFPTMTGNVFEYEKGAGFLFLK